jgi:uncharacterized protein (TIGR02594 family)
MKITAYDLAARFTGLKEVSGPLANPQIMAMLKLDGKWPKDDSVPWCSAFVNYIAWLLRLPRSKSLRARSWLQVGRPVGVYKAAPGFDVAILSRGADPPGPEVIEAPGHVGFYAGANAGRLMLLGGNQSDSVGINFYADRRLLGIRRLINEC